MIADADSPALVPKNSSNAGTKSLLDNRAGTAAAAPRPPSASGGTMAAGSNCETGAAARSPRPPAGRLPRRGHLHGASGRGHLPRPGVSVADHQPVASLLALVSVRGDVRLDLGRQRRGQHPPGTLPDDLIQPRGQLLARSRVLDYLQHRRSFPPALPRRHLVSDHSGRYAAPSLRSRIHNIESYLVAQAETLVTEQPRDGAFDH